MTESLLSNLAASGEKTRDVDNANCVITQFCGLKIAFFARLMTQDHVQILREMIN